MRKISSLCNPIVFSGLIATITGCDRLPVDLTSANAIQQAPASFEGREVKLRGTVRQVIKLPLINLKGYRIQDASGEAMVVTKGNGPGEGEEVIVIGKVENLMIIGGQSPGAVIQETKRLPVDLGGIAWGKDAQLQN